MFSAVCYWGKNRQVALLLHPEHQTQRDTVAIVFRMTAQSRNSSDHNHADRAVEVCKTVNSSYDGLQGREQLEELGLAQHSIDLLCMVLQAF